MRRTATLAAAGVAAGLAAAPVAVLAIVLVIEISDGRWKPL